MIITAWDPTEGQGALLREFSTPEVPENLFIEHISFTDEDRARGAYARTPLDDLFDEAREALGVPFRHAHYWVQEWIPRIGPRPLTVAAYEGDSAFHAPRQVELRRFPVACSGDIFGAFGKRKRELSDLVDWLVTPPVGEELTIKADGFKLVLESGYNITESMKASMQAYDRRSVKATILRLAGPPKVERRYESLDPAVQAVRAQLAGLAEQYVGM